MKPLAYMDAKPHGDPISIPRMNAVTHLRAWRKRTKVHRRVHPAAGYVKYWTSDSTARIYVRLAA